MSVIKGVLEEELKRLKELSEDYEKKIDSLRKGSISRKKRNKNVYLYWAFRENDKIKFIYIGPEGSDAGKKALEDRNKTPANNAHPYPATCLQFPYPPRPRPLA